MLVVCPHAPIRAWLLRRVFPQMRVRPLLLEPRHVPRIHDLERARDRPEAAVIAAVFHGHDLGARAVVETACRAILHLDPQTRDRYRYLIQTAAHEAMELPQPIQDPEPDDTPTEWEQRGLTWAQHGARFEARGRDEGLRQGLRQGREEGAIQARRDALLFMFDLLDLQPTPEQRARVRECDELSRLETWTRRLEHATSIADVFLDP